MGDSGNMRDRLWACASIAFLALAAFFRFALIGYGFVALFLFGFSMLIALCHFLKKRGMRKTLRAVLALTVLGFVLLGALEVPVVRASRGDDGGNADYLIVLGAGVNGREPSLSLKNRLDAALEYLSNSPGTTAIVTGGQGPGEDITEAEAMSLYLTREGIEQERVIMEPSAANTEENLRFSFDIIRSRGDGGASVAVCSSEYHLFRAQRLARALGEEVSTVPAKTTLPVLRLNYFLREGFAAGYMLIFG